MNKNVKLPHRIENARGEIITAVEKVRREMGLPACIIEGILSSVLADVRAEQKIEIINAANETIREMEEEKKEKEE